MALITISRGPWIIDTTLITSTTRTQNTTYNVLVIANGKAYLLTPAEAITLGVTIPQIPATIPTGSIGALLPDTNIAVLGTESAEGRLVILAWGVATSDATIVAQVGADALYADGSIYLSVVAGAGVLFQKQNDVWVANV